MGQKTKVLAGYFIIALAGLFAAYFVRLKSDADYKSALDRYYEASLQQAQDRADSISNSFKQIYQGVRTIAELPSVKAIDRHGTNLDNNAHETIIQIYKNLRDNVTVSRSEEHTSELQSH